MITQLMIRSIAVALAALLGLACAGKRLPRERPAASLAPSTPEQTAQTPEAKKSEVSVAGTVTRGCKLYAPPASGVRIEIHSVKNPSRALGAIETQHDGTYNVRTDEPVYAEQLALRVETHEVWLTDTAASAFIADIILPCEPGEKIIASVRTRPADPGKVPATHTPIQQNPPRLGQDRRTRMFPEVGDP